MSEEIGDEKAFPNAVNFFNEALSTDGVQDDYNQEEFLLYSEMVSNYLYITKEKEGEVSIPYFHGKLSADVSVTINAEGNLMILNNNINGFLVRLNNSITDVARANGFAENSDLTFGALDFSISGEGPINGVLKIDIVYNLAKLQAAPPGCAFFDDFAFSIGNGSRNGDEPCIKPVQRLAFVQINSALNVPDLCNKELKCTEMFDLTPQPSKFVQAYKMVYTTIANQHLDITTSTPGVNCYDPSVSCSYNVNLCHNTNKNVCVSASQIEGWFDYCVSQSAINKPIYNIPNTSTTIKKSIIKYEYAEWLNEKKTFGSTLDYFSNLSPGERYHTCNIYYGVCVKVPKYPIAVRDNASWKQTI